MDGWNASFLLGWPIFRGYVSFGEGNIIEHNDHFPHKNRGRRLRGSNVFRTKKVDEFVSKKRKNSQTNANDTD